jgi:hypothetical protein
MILYIFYQRHKMHTVLKMHAHFTRTWKCGRRNCRRRKWSVTLGQSRGKESDGFCPISPWRTVGRSLNFIFGFEVDVTVTIRLELRLRRLLEHNIIQYP